MQRLNHKNRILQASLLAIFEVPPQGIGEDLAAFLNQYAEILGVFCNSVAWEWSLDIFLDQKAFLSIHNCLEVGSLSC